MNYTIGDFLIRVKNGALAKRHEVVMTYTKPVEEIAKVLKEEGYLNDVKKEDNKIDLRIIDNGHGIVEENLQTIFEPYFTTKGKKGTGLGLATVKKLTELHNGTIDVMSKVGEGSEFRITI